ncbi:MAG: hypothetical protein OXE94_15520 [Aestuariivita sp.]|nr:hypothetical protein [Aestuariivita sp.]MCY4201382.1 hypothetical protein [Aestuariivita sp.]
MPKTSPVTVTTKTAPVAAPEDNPNKNGSAKSFRVVVCNTTPTMPRPAPITAAKSAQGNLNSKTIRWSGDMSPSANPLFKAMAVTTSESGIGAVP